MGSVWQRSLPIVCCYYANDSLKYHNYMYNTIYVREIIGQSIYCIAENVDGRRHWQFQLFRLFGGENFGKWSTNKIQILNIP